MRPELPDDELERVERLRRLRVLDTDFEARFDRITRLAARTFDVPIALVSLVDSNRQWFKSKTGLDARETHRDISFCGHAIHSSETFVVPDARRDPRFASNPLVTGPPGIRFYMGRPLLAEGGSGVGTLCLIDITPRDPDDFDPSLLDDLAEMVTDQLLLGAGLVTLCSYCQRIQLDSGRWRSIVQVLEERLGRRYSHGICPDCYPDVETSSPEEE